MKEQLVDALRLEIARWLTEWPELAEDIQLRSDMLDAETPIADVLTDLIRMGEAERMLQEGTKAQLSRLKARNERFDRRLEFTRSLIHAVLDAAALRKFELPEGTVYLRNNHPQLVGDPDPSMLPDELVKIERKPDKEKIKDALKRGLVVPGYELSNAPPSLVVLIK